MTDPETVTRLGVKEDLSRATQALKDAAMAYSVVKATLGATTAGNSVAAQTLLYAAEDYADAYLRGTK